MLGASRFQRQQAPLRGTRKRVALYSVRTLELRYHTASLVPPVRIILSQLVHGGVSIGSGRRCRCDTMLCNRGAKGSDDTTNPAGEHMRVQPLSMFLVIAAGVGFVPRLARRQWPGGPCASKGGRGFLILRFEESSVASGAPGARGCRGQPQPLIHRRTVDSKGAAVRAGRTLRVPRSIRSRSIR